MRRRACLVAIVFGFSLTLWPAAPARAQDTLTYPDLVKRLTDLEHLAVLPADGESCKQWSSWDRGSQYDAEAGKYVNWGANGDGGGIIRREGDLSVFAEMEGPGCIWRIWSARATKGHVKIYLDGQAEPAVDLPFEDYLSGETAPFAYPMLSYNLNKMGCSGQNLYFPIPYQKSCRIVAEKGWGAYYQFDYTTYPEGTKLPTFSVGLAAENADALAKVNAFLQDRRGPIRPAGAKARRRSATRSAWPPASRRCSIFPVPGRSRASAPAPRSRTARSRWRPCGNSCCASPSTAPRSRRSGARPATSSARRRGSTCTRRSPRA